MSELALQRGASTHLDLAIESVSCASGGDARSGLAVLVLDALRRTSAVVRATARRAAPTRRTRAARHGRCYSASSREVNRRESKEWRSTSRPWATQACSARRAGCTANWNEVRSGQNGGSRADELCAASATILARVDAWKTLLTIPRPASWRSRSRIVSGDLVWATHVVDLVEIVVLEVIPPACVSVIITEYTHVLVSP